MNALPNEALSSETIRGARDQLARLLDAVSRGDLISPPGMTARLEGALTVLDALLTGAVPDAVVKADVGLAATGSPKSQASKNLIRKAHRRSDVRMSRSEI